MTEKRLSLAYPLSQLVLILMAVLILYLAVDFGRQVVLSYQKKEELRQVQEKLGASQTRAGELEERLRYAKSPEAAEGWARQMGLVKPNEVPVVLVEPATAASTGGQNDAGALYGTQDNQDRWWEFFFGNR
jgi:cell division protein FtsB